MIIIAISVIAILSFVTVSVLNKSNKSEVPENKEKAPITENNTTNTENKITDIVIPHEKIVMKLNDKFSLKASIIPSNTSSKITYKVNDTKIASVDEYSNITGLSVGNTTKQ